MHQFWQKFTVKDAVDNLSQAWDAVNVATINHAWRKMALDLLPHTPSESIQLFGGTVADAVAAARQVPGFANVTKEEILDIHGAGEAATTEDIMSSATLEGNIQQEQQGVGADEEGPTSLSTIGLAEIFSNTEARRLSVMNHEPCAVRKNEILKQLDKCVRHYRELHVAKVNERKQSPITWFIQPRDQAEPVSEPQPSTSSQDDIDFLFTENDIEEFEGFIREAEGSNYRSETL